MLKSLTKFVVNCLVYNSGYKSSGVICDMRSSVELVGYVVMILGRSGSG
jgi:hypothetical protein